MSKYLYILDNGHGLNTKNKESKVWQDCTQLKEYIFNRDVVKLLSFMLRKDDIDFEIIKYVDKIMKYDACHNEMVKKISKSDKRIVDLYTMIFLLGIKVF